LKRCEEFNEITLYKYAVLAFMSERFKKDKAILTYSEFGKIIKISENVFNN
jgi:hypothetical protein